MSELPDDDDRAWDEVRGKWRLRADTVYLNHGSFGPSPEPVRRAQQAWKVRLDEQPMDFYRRVLPGALADARRRLAALVKTSPANLVFVDNATHAMNIVAPSVALGPGDEVLITDHEYGAVRRIWERRTSQTGATCKTVHLPRPMTTAEQLCQAIFAAVTARTRLLVVSHISSPTAVTMPVSRICADARRRGVAVCIDGPHALAQLDLDLDGLDCTYYAASCHKWLSAPFGSGFLYVAPEAQPSIVTPQLSWGVLPPDHPKRWDEEFQWVGTRDPSPYLAVPDAIGFLERIGLDAFRRRTHWLARYARQQLAEFSREVPLTPESGEWYTSMAHMPLPSGDAASLQDLLWERFRIEIPIVQWGDRRWIRVSCHLYNRKSEIDLLTGALRELLMRERQ